MEEYGTWRKVGKVYMCGCCKRIPVFVDIRDLTVCPRCLHNMDWYETDEGIMPMRIQAADQNEKENEHKEE